MTTRFTVNVSKVNLETKSDTLTKDFSDVLQHDFYRMQNSAQPKWFIIDDLHQCTLTLEGSMDLRETKKTPVAHTLTIDPIIY